MTSKDKKEEHPTCPFCERGLFEGDMGEFYCSDECVEKLKEREQRIVNIHKKQLDAACIFVQRNLEKELREMKAMIK